jgi:hypothetical protein
MPHDLACDWRSGFVMDPSKKSRVGYLVHFTGLNMGDYLHQDITVFSPYNNSETGFSGITLDAETKKATVVGLIEHFSYAGGVGDPICVSAYISAQNAEIIKAKMQSTLDTTIVKQFAWWIVNFDEENKAWFEESYPKDPVVVAGQLNAPGGKDVRMHVSDEATKVAPNIDVNVYNMYFEIVPGANATYALHFATSGKTKYVRNWGLIVGTNATQAMGT